MHRMESVILTNMCMIEDDQGRVVMQYHGGDWEGWCFPGGHVEYGESFTDAVIREVREETGLTISHPQLCGVKDWFHDEEDHRYMVLLYKARHFSGELRASSEGAVRWVPLEEMSSLPIAQGMDETLQVYLREDLSEQFFTVIDGKWINSFK